MLDAAALASGLDIADDGNSNGTQAEQIAVEESNTPDASETLLAALSQYQPLKSIVFIDPTVEGLDTLLQGLSTTAEEVVLSSHRDGITQITEYLADHSDIEAIHIISHGGDGVLKLGDSQLNGDTLETYRESLAAIGSSLTADGDILLYGCDVAQSQTGLDFLQRLAEITDADVAASIDDTGATSLGGDWDLEHHTGSIEAGSVISEEVQDNYGYLLAPPVAANSTVATVEDTTYVFSAADFNYSDPDTDPMVSIQVTSLETVGTLTWNNGTSDVAVTLDQVISKADIDAGKLKFAPLSNANGTTYDSFGFSVNDGTLDSLATYTMTVDVTAQNDALTGYVAIRGTVAEGQNLTVDSSNLADVDGLGTLNYQWQRDGVNISGATASTYTLVTADTDTITTVVVSYTDDDGTAESVAGGVVSTLGWVASDTMNLARRNPVSVELADGRIMVAGGVYSGVRSLTVEIYDPATGTWSYTGSSTNSGTMGGRDISSTLTLLTDGRVLAVGGGDIYSNQTSSIWDPATGNWTNTAPHNTAFSYHHDASLLQDGRVLVMGEGNLYNQGKIYNPATNSWSAAGTMNAASGASGFVMTALADGRVFAALGLEAEIYDPATNSWSLAATPTNTIDKNSTHTVLDDGRILFVSDHASPEVYDPVADAWSAAGTMTNSRTYTSAVLLSNGTVLIAGGYDGGALITTEIYNPVLNSWSAGNPLAEERYAHVSAELPDGSIIVMGGRNTAQTEINTMDISGQTPVLLSSGLTADEGAVTVLAGLSAKDANDTAANLTYSIASAPANGTLSSTSFTQAELAAGDITYTHDGSETTSDSIDFVVTDPLGLTDTATLTLTINPVNDAPVIGNLTTGSASEGDNDYHATILDADVVLSDAELDVSNDYSGASLTLVRNGASSSDDVFSFDMTGALFTVSGSDLQSGGNTFATFTNTNGTLTITFTSSGTAATGALVDDVAQHIAYRNSNDIPPASVDVDWAFDDGNSGAQGPSGALSDTVTQTVNITAVDDAPVLAVAGSVAFLEDGSAIIVDNGLTITDVDGGNMQGAFVTITNMKANDVLAFEAGSTGISGSFNTATGILTLSGSATAAQYQEVLRSVTFDNTALTPDQTDRNIEFHIGHIRYNEATGTSIPLRIMSTA